MNGTIDARERERLRKIGRERERERERETTRERCNEGKPANQLATQPTDTKVMSVSSTHRQAVHCTVRLVMPQEMGQAPYVFIVNTSSRILFAWQTSGQQHNSRSILIPEISASNRLFRKRGRWHAGWFTRIATIIANSILPAAALHLPDGRQRCGGFEFRNTCSAIGG